MTSYIILLFFIISIVKTLFSIFCFNSVFKGARDFDETEYDRVVAGQTTQAHHLVEMRGRTIFKISRPPTLKDQKGLQSGFIGGKWTKSKEFFQGGKIIAGNVRAENAFLC